MFDSGLVEVFQRSTMMEGTRRDEMHCISDYITVTR